MSLQAGVKELIELMAEKAKEPADRALLLLLTDNAEHLLPVNDYFHKGFRQTDVTPSGKVDMAIWHLIGSSDVFWRCFNKVLANISANEPAPAREE